VATDGGVSVIKDDGSVVDITAASYSMASSIAIRDDNNLAFALDSTNTKGRYIHVYEIPTADVSTGAAGYLKGNALAFYTAKTASSPDLYSSATLVDQHIRYVKNALGNTVTGLTLLKENTTTPSKGSVAYITSDYNTGYMVGDIKLAALSDTDDTNLGTELGGNAQLADTSRLASHTYASGDLTFTLTEDSNSSTASGYIRVNFNGVIGKTYNIDIQCDTAFTADNDTRLVDVTSNVTVFAGAGTTDLRSLTFIQTGSLSGVYLYSSPVAGSTVTYTISVKEADVDRSVNANGLAVHGTITKTPVATGADLVGYSGFSASNYLEQPYNSDLDFGTGDFSIMGWWSTSTTASQIGLFRSDGDASSYGTGALFHIELSGTFKALIAGAGYVNAEVVSYPAASFATGGMRFVVIARASGTLNMYIDGILVSSVASDNTMTNTSARLKVGERDYASRPWQGDIALVRISATAPSAQQIKDIYEAEKPLFQDNAQATLYGTSDAVTALAHDDTTNLLHVGTSSGRSVFQGLRRVDNTTSAVGSAISASNNLVVEE